MGARQGVMVVPQTLAQWHIPRNTPLLKQWGAFTPTQSVPTGVCPLVGHDLPPNPQANGIFSTHSVPTPPKKIHSLLIPSTESRWLLQMGGWELPPAPFPDIWVSLSFHISSQHLKPFFSWQKVLGGGVIAFGPRRSIAGQSFMARAAHPWLRAAFGIQIPIGHPGHEFWECRCSSPPLPPPPVLFYLLEEIFPSDVANGTGWIAIEAAAPGDGEGRTGVCVCVRTHRHFWGPSLTSRDWEKFTYTAHFHMSQLRLAEATICAGARRSGFFPAQRW